MDEFNVTASQRNAMTLPPSIVQMAWTTPADIQSVLSIANPSVTGNKQASSWTSFLKYKIMELSFTPVFKTISHQIAAIISNCSDGTYKPWKHECVVMLQDGFLEGDQNASKVASLIALTDSLKLPKVYCINSRIDPVESMVYHSFNLHPFKSISSVNFESKCLFILEHPDLSCFEQIVRKNWGLYELSSITIISHTPAYESAKAYPYFYKILPFMLERNLITPIGLASSKTIDFGTHYLSGLKVFQFPMAIIHQLDTSFW